MHILHDTFPKSVKKKKNLNGFTFVETWIRINRQGKFSLIDIHARFQFIYKWYFYPSMHTDRNGRCNTGWSSDTSSVLHFKSEYQHQMARNLRWLLQKTAKDHRWQRTTHVSSSCWKFKFNCMIVDKLKHLHYVTKAYKSSGIVNRKDLRERHYKRSWVFWTCWWWEKNEAVRVSSTLKVFHPLSKCFIRSLLRLSSVNHTKLVWWKSKSTLKMSLYPHQPVMWWSKGGCQRRFSSIEILAASF